MKPPHFGAVDSHPSLGVDIEEPEVETLAAD